MNTAHYKGFEILEVPYKGMLDNYESFGLQVDKAYSVVDAFGDAVLPLAYNTFWTPTDAAHAIDAALWLQERIGAKADKWPTSTTHEYNVMLTHRRKFFQVFQALKEIEDMCIAARDLDENPRESVIGRLQLLRLEVAR